MKPTNLNFTSGVLLISVPDGRACEPGLGDLPKPTTPAYFFVVKVMFIGVMNFGQIQKLRFVGVKIFWSCSTMTFGHLHWVMLTSLEIGILLQT